MADASVLSEKILSICSKYKNGATQEDLEKELNETAEVFVPLINKLNAEKKLDFLSNGKTLVFKTNIRSDRAKLLVTNDREEKIVFQAIEKSEENGISVREIQLKTALISAKVQKIVKKLEKERHIKSFSTINKRGTKLYIVADIEPAANRTGGAFYKNGVFDKEFVNVVTQLCLGFLQKKLREAEIGCASEPERVMASRATIEEVVAHIKSQNVASTNRLNNEDIEKVLDSLVFDDKVFSMGTATKIYEAKPPTTTVKKSSLTFVEFNCCSLCPYEDDCDIAIQSINPTNCDYMKQWTNLDW